MNKMQMAHDFAMKLTGNNETPIKTLEGIVEMAWKYADAMQAEAEKRNKAEAEQKRKEVREILSDANTFIEREGQHFDDVEPLFEVDWRIAPNDAIGWMIFDGASTWLGADGYLIENAPSFGFKGSHIVERPQ